jgi:hypothetical protein
MKRKEPRGKASTKRRAVDLGQLYDNNVRLLTRASQINLKAYVEIVKSLTDPGLTKTAADAFKKVAEGWRDALIESNKILRDAYATLGREIK